jgi:hypothetical protein
VGSNRNIIGVFLIVFGPHDVLGAWLCGKIDYAPTRNLRCLANITDDGKILGVVGFDGWNGASCQLHIAGEGNWVTRQFIRCVFDYAFNTAKLKVLFGIVPSGTVQALKFDKHIGFKEIANIQDAHPDGSLYILSMKREDCRYLEK